MVDTFHGTDEEMYVAFSQVSEAIRELRRLRAKCDELNKRIFELENNNLKQ